MITFLKKYNAVSIKYALLLLTVFLVPIHKECNTLSAQEQTFTIGSGTTSSITLGVNPFATINRNSRSQYLYYSFDLINEGATNGNIIAIAFNITALALPVSLKPENITIKLGLTNQVVLGETLIENLPVYYSSSVENITETGWYVFNLDTPFVYDGERNIIVEICRSNENFGTSFQVETTLNNENDFRTTGLYSNETTVPGCSLTGVTPMTPSNRRRIPNIQFTMTSPCDGLPTPGVTQASSGPYCSGTPFSLSVANGATESGLFYQWQSSPNDNGPWSNILFANEPSLTISQSVETYYRRATTCLDSQLTANSFPIQIGGEGCYCSALVQNENQIGITQVNIGPLTNSSSSLPAYSNFTNVSVNLERGEDYPLSVLVTTNGGTNVSSAWIDWNKNAVFEESEKYDLGTVTNGTNVSSGSTAVISIPEDAALGSVIMRVRTSQSGVGTVEPCGPITNGESEDYTLNIIENLSIPGQLPNGSDLNVFVQNKVLFIANDNDPVKSLGIYDVSGRLLGQYSNDNGLSTYSVALNNVNKQVLILFVTTNSERKHIKKIALN